MKAVITKKSNQFNIMLTPENDQDKEVLKEFGKTTLHLHTFHCKGFTYLSPDVEFYVQPEPSRSVD